MKSKIKHTKSSGNVFADLGFKDAKERLVKAELALKIKQLLAKRNLKQIQAAKILGINQPKVSAITNGNLTDFSIEKMIEFLNKLDQDVEIVIHQKPQKTKRAAVFKVSSIHSAKTHSYALREPAELYLATNQKVDYASGLKTITQDFYPPPVDCRYVFYTHILTSIYVQDFKEIRFGAW